MNWTDPTGMTNSGYTQVAAMSAGALTAGQIATSAMFATAAGTAAYLAIEATKRNALSSTSGTISCWFFSLADSVGAAGALSVVGIDQSACGVVVHKRVGDPPVAGNPPMPAPAPDPCDDRYKDEIRRCNANKWSTAALDYIAGCKTRAKQRQAMCYKNGGPDGPGEMPEWDHNHDTGDSETGRNFGR
jgi:hypothetical protein